MGFLSSLSRLFNKEEIDDKPEEISILKKEEYEIDEEDRLVVALAASIMAGKDKPDSYFHISKMTRIK
ncbi:hypothetical protein [Clostridium polynesiense]|uniref:hypothetical protein n=1 Tax=Clostridium polynesiense TaxID=1325933 RepID=UPI00058CE3E8|nr:hypothetical protein [Clostridium polynesiense]